MPEIKQVQAIVEANNDRVIFKEQGQGGLHLADPAWMPLSIDQLLAVTAQAILARFQFRAMQQQRMVQAVKDGKVPPTS